MRHFASLQDVNIQDAWLTIGSFDGVHIGHQQILKEMTAGAAKAGATAVAITFYPHPEIVLRGPHGPFYLTTPEEKAHLLGKVGCDIVITLPFDKKIASISAHDFVTKLNERLGLAHLFVGQDFALGHDREGNVTTLRKYGKEMEFEVHETPVVKADGEVVSSSRIRKLLSDGKIEQANSLLGRSFTLTGEVERGEGRGRKIGIPTANLDIWNERATPGSGVYVCQAEVNGQSWQAVTNIGVRPTFGSDEDTATVETHLLDFDEDIYGKSVRLKFLKRLRGEQKFAGVDELVNQIKSDIVDAKSYFAVQDAAA